MVTPPTHSWDQHNSYSEKFIHKYTIVFKSANSKIIFFITNNIYLGNVYIYYRVGVITEQISRKSDISQVPNLPKCNHSIWNNNFPSQIKALLESLMQCMRWVVLLVVPKNPFSV